MKNKLVLATVLALSGLTSGCATDTTPPLSVVSLHDATGKTKADVCRAARAWVALNFKDSKAVVEVYDLEAGTMIGKGRMTVLGHAGTPFPVDFTLQVDCKDGRARATYDGFMANSSGHNYPLREDPLNNLKTKTAAKIAEMDAGLGAALKSQKSGADW